MNFFYGKHCLWMGVLNKYFKDNIEIKKGQPIGFFVVEPENKVLTCTVHNEGKKGKEKLHAEKQEGRQEAF